MAGLNTEQQAAFQTLLEFGCSETDARKAVQRFGGNVTAAANWIYDGAVEGPAATDDDAPPPLISTDEALPHPSTLGQPPRYSGPQLPSFGPAPAVEQQNLIDWTNDNGPAPAFAPPRLLPAPHPSPTLGPSNPPPTGDADLSDAIKASQVAADDQDAELSKAISLSMVSLGSTDEQAVSEVEKINPEDRIREGNSPPVLRATSAFMSGLASYLQALYAVPSFRNTILSWRLPENRQNEGLAAADFKDYWKGDAGISSLGMPIPVGGEQDNRFTRLVALQRLFALMTETKRSFLHITEVVRAFGLRDSDFQQPGGAWVYKVLEMHATIVDDLRLAAGEEAQYRLAQGISPEEAEQYEQQATSRFMFRGRVITANEHIGVPLPPDDDVNSTPRLSLYLNPSADPPEDLFRLLDKQLITSNGADNMLHLLTQVPMVLLFHIDRTTNVTSLETFGSGNNSLQKRVFRPTPTGKEDVWLDRYWVKNRVRIHETRKEIQKLDGELEDVRRQKKVVVVTEDGKDFQELVRATVDYCSNAKAEAGNVEREERQRRMRGAWEKVEEELRQAVDAFDVQISHVSQRISSAFDSPDMHRIGPYRLTSFVVRNGLNGRGTAWSVFCDDDGKWWRTGDLGKKEVSLEEALSDPSGLMMDAGSTFFFYSKVDELEEGVEIPPHLKRAAIRDNIEFASTLPDSHANIVASWSLPPLSSLEPEAIQIPLGETADDDSETVKDISLDSPPPDDVMVEDKVASQVDTPMSLEESQQGENVPAMHLRGGTTVEDEAGDDDGVELNAADEDEESDFDDEEIDEDEVELGLLQPMPAKKEDWDIDYAVGKIGGVPKWLDPRSPLAPVDVECGACGKTMSMLLQVNSPDDTRPHAAARSLYVFACRTSGCSVKNASQTFRVWRTQIESPNAFFPHTEETLRERARLEDALDAATALASAPSSPAKLWPEFDIAAEPEPYEESYLPLENAPAAEVEDGTEDAAATDTKTGVDSAFLHFQERIEREPKQVLRFYRLPGVEDPQPLWASEDKIRPEQVPTCELCRGERKVEFQVLSTLLTSLDDDSFDFDSILVYTCANHCPIPSREGGKTGWQVECAFKQDFAAAGVKFGRR
ncbi:programmed cell death protein 2 [Rhodotorula toruloides]|uniref:Programmed cell death protein 2 n=1 Tax=Rhodotorula toruloides TaxID=5286 RepID=A0A511KM13_RHOTO|nr:programmed cell death protein 2 [Rhodotorula toruloides]